MDAIAKAISSEWISGGPCILELEGKAADICGVRHAFAVCNGTAAIQLLYLARGYRPGDEIILPSFGYHAAANIALQAGLTPVFADVLPDTWCLDPAEVARLRTPRTRAVMAVQTYGNMCEMRPLRELCAENGIDLLEDAAESFGSSYEGVMSGALGLAGTLSFHATKAITTGEGGMVLTDDDALADKVGLYRSHGMRRQKRHYWHELPGNNFRLTNFQAAMGCAQIAHFQRVCEERGHSGTLQRNPGRRAGPDISSLYFGLVGGAVVDACAAGPGAHQIKGRPADPYAGARGGMPPRLLHSRAVGLFRRSEASGL